MLINQNDAVMEIAKEAAKLDPLEQQILLTRLRVKRLRKKRLVRIASTPKGIKRPTLKQINKWKHESKSGA